MAVNVSFRWHGPTETSTGEAETIQVRYGPNHQKYMLCSVAALISGKSLDPLTIIFSELSNAEISLYFKTKQVTRNSPEPQPSLSPISPSISGKRNLELVVSLEHAKFKPFRSPVSYPKA